MTSHISRQRIESIDFWRGVALLMIYINHMPENPLSGFTLKTWGFSDSAELFVFLAGVTSAMVVGQKIETDFRAGFAFNLSRVWQLFRTHIMLIVGLSAVIAVAGLFTDSQPIKHEFNFYPFFFETDQAIIKLLRFAYMPNMTDILPLYVILMFFFPLIWWLQKMSPGLLLAISGILWIMASQFGLSPSNHPDMVWHFNPFAWQFMYVAGVLGFTRRQFLLNRFKGKFWVAAAGAIALFGFLAAAPWVMSTANESLRLIPAQILAYDNKTNLSPLRVLHFTALLLLAIKFWPHIQPRLSPSLKAGICCTGQMSLFSFCFGALLSLSLYILYRFAGFSAGVYMILSLGGVLIIVAGAYLARHFKTAIKTPKSDMQYAAI